MKKREEKLGRGEKRREKHKDRIDLSEKKREKREKKKKSRVESSGMDCGREEKRREEVKFCVEREREREREATVSERSGGTVLHPRCRLLLGIGGAKSGL